MIVGSKHFFVLNQSAQTVAKALRKKNRESYAFISHLNKPIWTAQDKPEGCTTKDLALLWGKYPNRPHLLHQRHPEPNAGSSQAGLQVGHLLHGAHDARTFRPDARQQLKHRPRIVQLLPEQRSSSCDVRKKVGEWCGNRSVTYSIRSQIATNVFVFNILTWLFNKDSTKLTKPVYMFKGKILVNLRFKPWHTMRSRIMSSRTNVGLFSGMLRPERKAMSINSRITSLPAAIRFNRSVTKELGTARRIANSENVLRSISSLVMQLVSKNDVPEIITLAKREK